MSDINQQTFLHTQLKKEVLVLGDSKVKLS